MIRAPTHNPIHPTPPANRYVKPAYEKMMDAVHSREEVLKAADDALAQVF